MLFVELLKNSNAVDVVMYIRVQYVLDSQVNILL